MYQRLLAAYRKELISRPTEGEILAMQMLNLLGIKYHFQKGFFSYNKFYIIDFYIPKLRKLCLEIDGLCHECNDKYDLARDSFLRKVRGFRVVRITNDEIMNMTTSQFHERIRL